MSDNNTPFVATYVLGAGGVGLTASEIILLVDLSDTTNWPHGKTNKIILMGINMSLILIGSTKEWNILPAVVLENDATDGSVAVVENHPMAVSNVNIGVARTPWITPGIDLEVVDGSMVNCVSSLVDADNVAYKNDATFNSAAGAGKLIAPGDLIVSFSEVADGATLKGFISAYYRTE